MTVTRVSTQNNNQFFLLNYDVLCRVLSELPRPQDIFSVLVTDKFLSAFVTTSVPLWQNFLASHFPFYTPISIPLNPKGDYQCLKNREDNMKMTRYDIYPLEPLKKTNHSGAPPGFYGGIQGETRHFSIKGNKLVFGLKANTIEVRDLLGTNSPKFLNARGDLRQFVIQDNHLSCSAFSWGTEERPDLSGPVIFVWDLNDEKGKPRHILTGHQEDIQSLTIQNNTIVSSSADSIRIYNLEDGKELNVLKSEDAIGAHAAQGDTHFIASNNVIKVHDIKSGKVLYTLEGHEKNICKLVIQGTTLISFEKSDPYICKIWDLKSGKELYNLKGKTYIDSPRIAIIDNVLFIVGQGQSNAIEAWNLKTGEQLSSLLFDLCYDTFRDIQSDDGKLYFCNNCQLFVYDFNLEPLPPQTPEEKLSQLQIMARLERRFKKTAI